MKKYTNKGYAVLTDYYCVGYINASTPGKAKSLALSSSLITDDCEFIDLLIYRCKALDSVFHCLPESANILDPTEASDVKILKKVGLCVDEQFYYNTKN
jgi:hypothetical protein